jgi:hypothetical protein
MGKRGADFARDGVELKDLPALLGEGMPKLEFHALGRVRLMGALRQRFGDGFRNIPGIAEVIKKFDHEAKVELEHHKLRKHYADASRKLRGR